MYIYGSCFYLCGIFNLFIKIGFKCHILRVIETDKYWTSTKTICDHDDICTDGFINSFELLEPSNIKPCASLQRVQGALVWTS